MRTCGVSVAAYFVVSESERYGSTSRKRPPRLSRKPLWPSHHSASPRGARRRRGTRRRRAAGSITARRSDGPHARDEVRELLPRRPARGLGEAAVGGEDEPLGGRELEEVADARGDVLRRLDLVALHVDRRRPPRRRAPRSARSTSTRRTRGSPSRRGSRRPHAEERREHRRVAPRRDGAALVVAEAEVRREPRAADDRLDRAVEDVDEALGSSRWA